MYVYNNRVVGIPGRLLYAEWNLMAYTTYEQYIKARILIQTNLSESETDEPLLNFHLLPEKIKQFCIMKLGAPMRYGVQDSFHGSPPSPNLPINYLAKNGLFNQALLLDNTQNLSSVLNYLIRYLVKEHAIDLLYLIESRVTEKSAELLILIISPTVKPYLEEILNTQLQRRFKRRRVTVTCLLHNNRWIKRHAAKFLPFIHQYLKEEHLAYSKTPPLHALFISPASELEERSHAIDWHHPFWETSQHKLKQLWIQMNVLPHSTYQLHHINPFRIIFKLLCINLIYKKLNYTPHLDHPNYLWQLVRWADLSFSEKLTASTNMERILSLLSKEESYFPSIKADTYTPTQKQYQDTLIVLNTLYDYVKQLYTSPNS